MSAKRRQGYTVEETGLGGADGGIDLILRKDGRRVLVQCKQWRRRQIPVNVVREMYGLLTHHNADAVKIACIGSFTRDAARFAQGKPIELIGSEELMRMIREVQTAPAQTTRSVEVVAPAPAASDPIVSPDCPRCGPLRQTSCRPDRIPPGAEEPMTWLDTDKHSKTAR